MDVGLGTMATPPDDRRSDVTPSWRPRGCDRIGLVLQGGGALGAYQAGVYQAMHEAGLEPDWVAGVSIGGVNAALIAGNPPERRLPALRDFWETVTSRRIWAFTPDGDDARKARNAWSAWMTTLLGIPGFFTPNVPGPWLTPRGGRTATSFYDSAPLRETLLRLVDFDRINHGPTRFACGAVAISDGNFAYFDNRHIAIGPEHVMASGALPPAMPMVRIGTDDFWDGGLVSNTPLQHVLDNAGTHNMLLFQVDLFSARGAVPRDMYDVLARQKDIQYSSRTRLVTDYYRRIHRLRTRLKQALDKVPEEALTEAERAERAELAMLPEITILQLIYQQAAYEGDAKDYEFSGTSMREHWESGYRDTANTLRRTEWLEMGRDGGGITVHDIHRARD
jgi:NTE family protein